MGSLFSIITVCYNSERTIRQTFESVLSQTIKGFEYIVIDGKSTDRTIAIIQEYESKFLKSGIKFKWISEPDTGIYDAMNKGISLASNKLIGIINSDDMYKNNALEVVRDYYDKDNTYNVYHGLVENVSEGKTVSFVGHSYETLKRGGMIEHPACFVTKDTYSTYGLYSLDYKFASDYEFMLRLLHREARFKLIPHILAVFDENGSGNSRASRNEAISVRRLYRVISRKKMYILYVKNWMRK